MNKFIKSSIRVDYKGGICKDFRDTGFCGFGDNCQFLHDRSDLYMGWELDNIFNIEEHRKKFLTRKRQMPPASWTPWAFPMKSRNTRWTRMT